jgi:hypothetical protein
VSERGAQPAADAGPSWVFHRLTPLRRGLLPVADPTILLLIVSTWAAMLAVGWALRTEAAEDLYAELTSRLVAIQIDLVTFPIAYYFAGNDERYALLATMPYMLELSERVADDEDSAGLRLRGALMREAIDDFALTTAERFHGHRSDSTLELLAAYSRDHLRGGPATN